MNVDLEKKLAAMRELQRLVNGVVEWLEAGEYMVVDPKWTTEPFDMILGGRFGIVDLKNKALRGIEEPKL